MTSIETDEKVGDEFVNAPKKWRRTRSALSMMTVGAFALIVITKRAALASSFTHLGHPHWSWIPIAIAFELVSMGSLALMQRELLNSGGKRIGHRSMTATVFAANALSVSVPVAGPELGAAFAFRRYRKLGADTHRASWAVLVGGLVSAVAGILVLVVGGAFSDNEVITAIAIMAGIFAVTIGAVLRLALARAALPPRLENIVAWMLEKTARLTSHPIGDPHQEIRDWMTGLGSLRLTWDQWTRAGSFGLMNWLADIGVLAISIVAIGAPVPWTAILLIYSAAILVSSIGLTPGGIGFVEGTLCVGLVSVGVPAALALAAVLLYRLVSFWLMTAAGWLVLLYLRLQRPARAPSLQGSVPS